MMEKTSLENLKRDMPVYSRCGFDIYYISEERDRIDIFELLLPKFNDHMLPLNVVNERNALKQKVQYLYQTLQDTTFVVRKNNEFVGFFSFRFHEHSSVPIIDHVQIAKKFQRTRALACMIDYSMNYLYVDKNIQVDDIATPGFGKIVSDHMIEYGMSFVKRSVVDRVSRICSKCKD